ncbi:lipase member H [Sinocyclocheilus grahami]|uniref:lipase member H n=1 Tax=Sinocyclocheilus grahami TaxID=75366 RepID=UPI0007AD36BB|nr:PREDICTED: lipase member H-like [Sinocyclocheilus grahami]
MQNVCWLVFVTLMLMFDAHRAQECEEMTDLDLKHSLSGTSLSVRLLLYTRVNVSCAQLLSHREPFRNPRFNLSSPSTFLIHGYRPTGSPPVWLTQFVQLLLQRRDMNVIVVDWNRGATNINYWKVVDNTRKVAANLTDLIQKMKEKGADLGSIHMIGVSLGAHISGFTGANFKGSIGRITALDPAGPEFNGQPPSERLDPSDAQFVEALHTDMDALGYRDVLGHIDYYANGGADQPGCPRTIFSEFGYKVDIITWNQKTHWGYLTIKLSDGQEEAQVELNHKSLMFERFVESSVLAQFDRDVQPVKEISLKFCTGKGLRPSKKLRLLRIRLTPLQNHLSGPLCRYDLLLEENKEVTFRPIPCEDSNF